MTTIHDPIVHHYPEQHSPPQPEEISVACTCGEWGYESIASAGGPCDTAWAGAFEDHLLDAEGEPDTADCGEADE